MTIRLTTLIVTTCLCAVASAQPAAVPNLSRSQRELLQAIITAVDAAAATSDTADASWQSHIMRASDGSHYVAFSMAPNPSQPIPSGPVVLYVRLASADGGTTEKSAVREFLAGKRTDPRLLPRRNIAIGDMPAFGPSGSIGVRGSTATTGSNELRLMDLERESAKKEQQARDKQRRAELEGKAASGHELFPFEDFDVGSHSISHNTRVIARAFTAGPGEHTLLVGWADPSAPKPVTTIRVFKRTLSFPPAATAFSLSSIVLADDVTVRAVPYAPAEQAAHPYTIGATEITPAADAEFTRDERLAVAFQVINPKASETGKPDLAVTFRIVKIASDREIPIASLNPQFYTEATLPADFDLRLGHPIFAAVSAPLGTLARGSYRLKTMVSDRIGGAVTTADTDFTMVGTPLSLLAEAPALAPAFKRDAILAPASVSAIVRGLTPASPSPALGRALGVATSGKFVDLLVEEPVPAPEAGVRTALTGLALLSIGDASAATQLQRALQQDAPRVPVQFLIGAARAMQSRDPDAILAWQSIVADATAPAATSQLLLDAYLRRGDYAKAAETVAANKAPPPEPAWTRSAAAAHIANRAEADAIALLEPHLLNQPEDQEARWLLLHALYAQFVHQRQDRADNERFATVVDAYLRGNGIHRTLALDWLAQLK